MKAENIDIGMQVFVKESAVEVRVPKTFTGQVCVVAAYDPSTPDYAVSDGKDLWYCSAVHLRKPRQGDRGFTK